VASAYASDLGHDDARRIADEDILDGALPGNEHAYLPADAMGYLAEKAGQLGRDDVRGGHAPAIDAL
jgi:hypothetical protein